jgi:hypothetical protein
MGETSKDFRKKGAGGYKAAFPQRIAKILGLEKAIIAITKIINGAACIRKCIT